MAATFVLGGARSGKTSYAERIAKEWSQRDGKEVVYVATAQVTDGEMEVRINRHRRVRPANWQTVEEPVDVASIIANASSSSIVLVDCLSLLLNNWMFIESCSATRCFERMRALTEAIEATAGTIIVVSNEVGQGIVPADALSRQYRDWLGLLNQAVASVAASVVLVVAGIPIDLRKVEALL